MADTLVTAVDAVVERLLDMERLAVPEATGAYPRWYEVGEPPYWLNVPLALGTPTGPEDVTRYELVAGMRLVLGNAVDVAHDAEAVANVQNKAWTWLPQVMRYFQTHRRMNPPGLPGLRFLAPEGVTIRQMRQPDLNQLRLPVASILYALDFELTIPFEVGYGD
ncbi:MAG: hypothetical protein WCZ87_00320 [Thiohalobacteraceae bacterium]